MHRLDIYRLSKYGQDYGTFSEWKIDGNKFCYGVEKAWRNNQRRISCIPIGNYTATIYNSPLHGRVYQLNNVPGRSSIQIHSANFADELEGCLAPGENISEFPDGKLGVTSSKKVLNVFMELCERDRTIEVVIHADKKDDVEVKSG
jgi:hypothetical protein